MPEVVKILAVDDDPSMQSLLKAGLAQRGFEIDCVSDTAEVFKTALRRDVQVILLDLNMPRVSGISILQVLGEVLPDVPTIVLTASDKLDRSIEAMKHGAFHYLVKPIRWDELLLYIDKAVKQHKMLMERRRLAMENIRYQAILEEQVAERTAELQNALGRLREVHIETILAMASAIEAKDVYTQGHCKRVHDFSMALAKAVKLSPGDLSALEYGSLLHDIGKIGIPEAVLNKPGKLDDDEFMLIQTHPLVGARIVERVEFFKDALIVVRHHHERIDGKGYPDGIEGDGVPVIARIAAIADAYDAMTSDRPYRKGLPAEEAVRRLQEGRGTQFDGELVDTFIEKDLYRIDSGSLTILNRETDIERLRDALKKRKSA